MARGTDGLVDIDEVGMWWKLRKEDWFSEKARCDQRMVREQRGMLDCKKLGISCGSVRLGGKKDAGELATAEDLGEKGIFRDASAEQLVSG